MRISIVKLFITAFVILFSLKGFSQTTSKSNHPLLDKYYPQKQTDTVKNIPPQINPTPVTENSAAPQTPSLSPPVAETKTVTGITTAKENNSVSGTTLISNTKPALVATDTIAISKPVNVTITAPVQKKIQPVTPVSPPYNDNRLGSSTPAYDTWEKNNNGAGSVTTSPK